MSKYQFKRPALCDCGRLSVKMKNSSGICERCLRLEDGQWRDKADKPLKVLGLPEYHVALDVWHA